MTASRISELFGIAMGSTCTVGWCVPILQQDADAGPHGYTRIVTRAPAQQVDRSSSRPSETHPNHVSAVSEDVAQCRRDEQSVRQRAENAGGRRVIHTILHHGRTAPP